VSDAPHASLVSTSVIVGPDGSAPLGVALMAD